MATETLAGFRLSPQQEHLVASAGDAGFPISACLYECTGPISAQTLGRALETLVARHEILRTVFRKPRELKVPLQIILDSDTPAFSTEDLASLSAAEQHAELRRQFAAFAQTTTKAGDGPVVSCKLFQLAENKQALLLSAPSMNVDAVSFQVLAVELQQVLSEQALSEDMIQYVDVTEWQHDLLGASEDAATAAKAFWASQAHTPLRLPLEVDAAAHSMLKTVPVILSAEDTDRLRTVAASSNAECGRCTFDCLALSSEPYDGRDPDHRPDSLRQPRVRRNQNRSRCVCAIPAA